MTNEELLKWGKPHLPYLRLADGLFYPFRRKQCHYKAIARYAYRPLFSTIARRKIKELGGWENHSSKSSVSIYFVVDNRQCRISDHPYSGKEPLLHDIVIPPPFYNHEQPE